MLKRSRHLIAIAGLTLFTSAAWAKVELWVWQPTPTSMRLVLPRVDDEAPQAAQARYMTNMNADAEMRTLLREHTDLPPGDLHAFSPAARGLKTFVLANDPKDMGPNPIRMQNLKSLFGQQGADVYALPIASDIGLGAADAAEYRAKIAATADLVIGLGGGDIDPKFYGRDNRTGLSLHVFPKRDDSEARLWKAILNKGRAYVIGICRSHQMLLSLLGYELVQDIETQLGLPSHREGHHRIYAEANSVYEPLLQSLTDHEINTIHHQGFYKLPEQGPTQVIGTDENGVTELTVFKNGHGATFQFHPELMEKKVAMQFAENVYQLAVASQTLPSAPSRVRDFDRASAPRCVDLMRSPR